MLQVKINKQRASVENSKAQKGGVEKDPGVLKAKEQLTSCWDFCTSLFAVVRNSVRELTSAQKEAITSSKQLSTSQEDFKAKN